MAITVAGKLVTGDGVAIADATIKVLANASSNLSGSEVINTTSFTSTTDAIGDYSFTLNNGSYLITVQIGSKIVTLGTAIVDGSTPATVDILELVAYIGQSQTVAQDILDQAVAAKVAAETAQTASELAQTTVEGLLTDLANDAYLGDINLAAIDASIASTAVALKVYDTSKDTDGGLWRLTNGFPSVALIVATTTTVTIYDADNGNLPVWMVFNSGSNTYFWTGGIKTCAMLNGELLVGTADRLLRINFNSNSATLYSSGGSYRILEGIDDRNNASATTPLISASNGIVNSAVNDVAMTVLPNAPIDSSTGLQIPYGIVGTDGNGTYLVSVITDSGTVYDIGADGGFTCTSVSIGSDYSLTAVRSDGTVFVWDNIADITADGTSPDTTYTTSDTLGTVTLSEVA